MKSLHWRPGGLSWRLAVSYFLVTLVAAFTIEVTLTLVQLVREVQQSGDSSSAQALEKQDVTQVAPYLEQRTPDTEALRYWLTFEVITRNPRRIHLVMVLDQQQQVTASASCDQSALLSSGSKVCTANAASMATMYLAQPQIHATIQRVMSSPGEIADTTSAGKNFIVAAVPGQTKQVIGELVAVFSDSAASQAVTGPGALLLSFWNLWQPAGIYFLLLAVLLGTVTGVLISRNLVRRLNRIGQAASNWSRGEFQVMVEDHSRDELGQLVSDLNSMAEQFKSLLSARQTLAVIEERNRLARELHDSVKQHVFTNALLVRAARKVLPRDPQKAQQHLQEAEELAEQTQQELIELIQALRPAALVNKGLASVIQDYLAAWSKRTGIAFDLRSREVHSARPEIEAALFRILQEALANVARHSKASQVEVALSGNADSLYLKVRDNGIGFEMQQVADKGVGLTGMRERVEMLSGKLTIESSPVGTAVEATVPLLVERAEEKDHERAKVKDG
jgi:signal transduction histidine kinase